MMHEIETARLHLRPLTLDDVRALTIVRSDPEVMRYIGAGAISTEEDVRAAITRDLNLREQHGFGRCAVILKEMGELIGWCGLTFLDETNDVEIGYGVAKAFWKKGIITEAARAMLRYGFEELKLPRIVAVAMPENEGSWRVMEKIGMRYVGRAFYYNCDVVYYEIAREDFTPDDAPYLIR